MAVHFHPLTVKHIRKETADCVSISFNIPETLAPVFAFREGQNITIKTDIGGAEIRRSYSVCTAPYENELRVAVKKLNGGLFSTFANDVLKTGDTLEVLPPTGKFNAKLHPEKKAAFLAIAAGSGITPVLSIIKHSLNTQPQSSFTLIYGNRDRHSIIFFEELEGLKNKYMERFNFINILSREKTDTDIFFGRITNQKLDLLSKLVPYSSFDEIYLCGPEEMVFSSSNYFKQLGIKEENIHFELFTSPGQNKAVSSTNLTEENTGPASEVTIKLDGRSIDFRLGYNSSSLLDAALQQGADLPYACKGGVCATCRAKLVEGKVNMDINYALEKEEIEQGFILTCQSHPRSEKLVVDFDIK